MNEIKKLIDDLAAQAQKIAGISLDEVVDDVDLLTVALATSNLTVVARTLSFAKEGEKGYIAAHRALDIGWNPSIREALVAKGFFTEGLRGLLNLAEANPIAGSRLMPIFEEAVEIHKDLGIPKKLLRSLKTFVNDKLETDGFSIGNINEDGKTPVNIAKWVEEKLEHEIPLK